MCGAVRCWGAVTLEGEAESGTRGLEGQGWVGPRGGEAEGAGPAPGSVVALQSAPWPGLLHPEHSQAGRVLSSSTPSCDLARKTSDTGGPIRGGQHPSQDPRVPTVWGAHCTLWGYHCPLWGSGASVTVLTAGYMASVSKGLRQAPSPALSSPAGSCLVPSSPVSSAQLSLSLLNN